MRNNIIIFLIYTRHKWRINYWNKKRNFGNNKTNEKGEKTMMLNIKKEKINNNRNNFNCSCNYDHSFAYFSRRFYCYAYWREWNINTSTKS